MHPTYAHNRLCRVINFGVSRPLHSLEVVEEPHRTTTFAFTNSSRFYSQRPSAIKQRLYIDFEAIRTISWIPLRLTFLSNATVKRASVDPLGRLHNIITVDVGEPT